MELRMEYRHPSVRGMRFGKVTYEPKSEVTIRSSRVWAESQSLDSVALDFSLGFGDYQGTLIIPNVYAVKSAKSLLAHCSARNPKSRKLNFDEVAVTKRVARKQNAGAKALRA